MKIYEAIIITEGEVKKQYLFAEGTRSVNNQLATMVADKNDILRVQEVTEGILQCDKATFIDKVIEVCRDSQKFDTVQVDFLKSILK